MNHRRLALAAILLVGLAYATMIQSFSWNQTSHYDLIRSLNHDGTTIDAYAVNTGDKVEYSGQRLCPNCHERMKGKHDRKKAEVN